MNRNDYYTIKFEDGLVKYIDQTRLPLEEIYIETDDYIRITEGIKRLEIRGAPAIGVAAAYALAAAVKKDASEENFNKAYDTLINARPTAVNLAWALNKIKEVYLNLKPGDSAHKELLRHAGEIHKDDIEKCRKMGENGLEIFSKRSTVLTHCNTGRLATGGDGTAFSVIKTAFENDLIEMVYADETRPLLQGSRLTAFELDKSGIPFKILPDSAAASLFREDKIDLVVTGADRVASNGDSANKIGTLMLAVICRHFDVPFYIAAPTSTIDYSINTGDEIPIEQRDSSEIARINGTQITRDEYSVYNPAFDVTPNHLIAGIITEEKLHKPPFNFTK